MFLFPHSRRILYSVFSQFKVWHKYGRQNNTTREYSFYCFFLKIKLLKKRKKEKGKQIVTEILKKNARGKEVTEKKQRCLLKNAVCFHLCGKT
jgi:hypothetical protein